MERSKMDAHEAIRRRRTIHQYEARALPRGALQRALEAALYAPNHHLTEPWRFVVVGARTRDALLRLGLELAGPEAASAPALLAQLELTVKNPAELVIVAQRLDPEPEVEREDYAAVACAIHNMSLSLCAEGVGSKWTTGGITTHPRVYAELGMDSEHERIVGFFWAGYPARSAIKTPARRRALEDVVRWLP